MRFSAVLIFLLCLAGTAHAAETKTIPTNINAAHMEYDADKQTVVFSGSVHVTRPDFELWSDKLTVYLDKSGAATSSASSNSTGMAGMQAGRIDHIVALGNVRMKNQDKEGTCGKATYYTAKDLFVMEDNPVLRQKDNVIRGATISHFMKTGRSEVSRPNATFSAPDRTGSGSDSPLNQLQDNKDKK